MSYKYYRSASPIEFNTPMGHFIDEFKALMDDSFLLASDIFTIKEETSFASGVMQEVVVRINNAASTVGSQRLGDDFKLILFQDLDHSVQAGSLFYFDDNYWIAYNTNVIKNLARSVMVRRCNNVLRWTDPQGNYHESYCSIDYPIKRPTDYVRTVDPVVPGGFINVVTQMNTSTSLIKAGQRFLFGNPSNWTCFKVFGSGVRNFLNERTTDNESAGLLALVIATDFVNKDTDNLLLGIADYHDIEYTFSAYPSSFSGDIGDSFVLQPNLKKNGFPSGDSVSFKTSGSFLDVSPDGAVTLLDYGTGTVDMFVSDNISASALINVEVVSGTLPEYEIRITPLDLFVYEKETKVFQVDIYFKGVIQPGVLNFSINTSGTVVPAPNYRFEIIDGNRFKVENLKKFLDHPLIIRVESGSLQRDIEIELKGSW